jgi:membrane protein
MSKVSQKPKTDWFAGLLFVVVAALGLRSRPVAHEATPAAKPPPDVPPPTSLVGKIDARQQKIPTVAFLVGVWKKFSDDRAGQLAALIAYYGFFSLFPLIMALSAILGIVLKGHADLRQKIQEKAASQIPLIGDKLQQGNLSGSGVALVIGIALALWAGLGAMTAVNNALDEVANVPMVDRFTGMKQRARGLIMLAVIGLGLAASTTAASLASKLSILGPFARFGLVAAAIAVNVLTSMAGYRVLCARRRSFGQLLPGSILAGLATYLLQGVLGSLVVNNKQLGAASTYGSFAVIIALLSWLFLMAQVSILGAVVNEVRANHLWPRSIKPRAGFLTPADRAALSAYAQTQTRVADTRITLDLYT